MININSQSMAGRIECNVKEGKNVVNYWLRSHTLPILWMIIPSTSKSMFSAASQFQYSETTAMTFPLVDPHLSTSKFFTIPRCVQNTLESQSTNDCGTCLLTAVWVLQDECQRMIRALLAQVPSCTRYFPPYKYKHRTILPNNTIGD